MRIDPLPSSAVEAAAAFHRDGLPPVFKAITETREEVTLVFAPADHTHRAWRLAAVQGLAREHAPLRVNAIAGDDEAAIAAAADYLARSPGVTGQYFVLDGRGAGNPLG
ncbi:hypothetical protein N0B51_05965 [Tsuneonella sp. YG55]|uniref:Short chain dehydrogenase-like proteobacteria domain-containing protein n=1 Tax=Tsuneonella litorea TaxID=2976475 RepID=A0A9X2W005_9SPHN|nr:hypothetical protein [Tsuneonella litorea]MCT2558522.1 hypothetical protein [Tsuneonella litorea]